jgi:ribosomal-protein-alanine N-acetyltransferase
VDYKVGITLKGQNKAIGVCGFHNWSKGDRRSEIGYILSKDMWRMGIMTEALDMLIPFGFSSMDLNRIDAIVHIDNIPSINLLEKFNFTREGLLRCYKYYMGGFHDFYMLSLLKNEYNKEGRIPSSR